MNTFDKISDSLDPAEDQPRAMDSDEGVYPGTVAWLRQLTLWRIITQPWLRIAYPRLYLEKPWLLVLVCGSLGILGGITNGAQKGVGGGVGKMLEGAALGGFVVGIVSVIVVSPVALGLWVIREVGRTRLPAGRTMAATNAPCLTASSSAAGPAEFIYRPNRFLVVLLFLFGIIGEALFCYFAFTARDLLASIMAIICPVGLVAMGAQVISAFVQERRVVLTHDQIVLPKPHWTGLSSKEIVIAFGDIADLQFLPAGLLLNHCQGKYFLAKIMFPCRSDFDRLTVLLAEALARSRRRAIPASSAEGGCSE